MATCLARLVVWVLAHNHDLDLLKRGRAGPAVNKMWRRINRLAGSFLGIQERLEFFERLLPHGWLKPLEPRFAHGCALEEERVLRRT